MHERALVHSLLRQVASAVQPSLPADVLQIRVSVGPLSGVEPKLVEIAFDELAVEQGFCQAKLSMKLVPLKVRCLECLTESDIMDFHFICNACMSNSVRVIEGDGFILLDITVDDAAQLEQST